MSKNKLYFNLSIIILSVIFSWLLLRYGVIAWLDGWMFLFPNSLQPSLYYWNSWNGLWDVGSAQWAFLILNTFRLFFWENIFLYQLVLFSFFFFCIFKWIEISIFYLHKLFDIKIGDNFYKNIFLVSLVYIIIPINITYRLIPLIGNSYFFYIMPIIIGFALRYLYKNTVLSGIQMILLITVFSFVTWITAATIGLMVFLLLLIFFLLIYKKIKISFIQIAFLFLFLILLNAFWIFPFIITWKTALSHGIAMIDPIANIDYLASILRLKDIIFFFPSSHWEMNTRADGFYLNWWIQGIWFMFFAIIVTFFLLQNKYRHLKIIFLIFFVLFIDLSSPSWLFSVFLKNNINEIPLLALYRTAFDKLIYVPTFIFVIMTYVLLNESKKYHFHLITVIVLIIFSYPLFSGTILKYSHWTTFTSITKVPDWYYSDFGKLSELGYSHRILTLPFYSGDRVVTNYGYFGLDTYSYFSDLHFLSNFSQRLQITKDLESTMNSWDAKKFDEIIDSLGVKYILVKPDALEGIPDYAHISTLSNFSISPVEQFQIFENNEYIAFYKKMGIFDVYENKDISHGIFKTDLDIDIAYISPVEFVLTIKNLHEGTLKFLQSFNSEWKIYIEKIHTNNNCETKINSFIKNDTVVNECAFQKKLNILGGLKKLLQKPIFEDSHKMVYNYANSWEIDADYIKNNFGKEFYKENEDGSIDVKLTLYFKPQSYFYLGLLLSSGIFMILISYLIFSFFRDKKHQIKK